MIFNNRLVRYVSFESDYTPYLMQIFPSTYLTEQMIRVGRLWLDGYKNNVRSISGGIR
jgi:hypothetical protein